MMNLPDALVHASRLAQTLESPGWMITEVLKRNALTLLLGAPGSGKSLLALDIALCVAVQNRTVVYVAAEAPEEHIPRLAAWESFYQQSTEHLHFWPYPLALADRSNVEELLAKMRSYKPALIIVDPLASCMVGLEESDAGDMKKAVESLNLLRTATGAAILVTHHTGWDDVHDHGRSALRAACHVVLQLSFGADGDAETVILTGEKGGSRKPFTRSFKIAEIADERGGSSVVLVPPDTQERGVKGLNWTII